MAALRLSEGLGARAIAGAPPTPLPPTPRATLRTTAPARARAQPRRTAQPRLLRPVCHRSRRPAAQCPPSPQPAGRLLARVLAADPSRRPRCRGRPAVPPRPTKILRPKNPDPPLPGGPAQPPLTSSNSNLNSNSNSNLNLNSNSKLNSNLNFNSNSNSKNSNSNYNS